MRVRGMVYLWTLCILLLPAWLAWGQPLYTVTDLGSMTPFAINEDGIIVGSAIITGVQTPVSWVAGHQTPLATLGAGGRVDAITRTSEAVGYVLTTPIATQQAAQWDAQGRLTLLPGVTSDLASAATAKNAAGWIAGYSDIPTQGGPLIRAKRWSPRGVVENLAPAGGSDSFGDAVDASNGLWGSADTAAVLWQRDGSVTDLNAQIDPRTGWLLRYARGLNTAGQIVGQGYLNRQAPGFLLTPISVSQQMVAVDEKPSWKDMPEHIRARLPARLFNR
jgi:hypothetical protein